MILSGLLFDFDKLHNLISTKGKVPMVADFMASLWGYEAMAVYNFKNNSFERDYYGYEKIESQADFKSSFLVDELNKKRRFIADNIKDANDSVKQLMRKDLAIIQQTLKEDFFTMQYIRKNAGKGLDFRTPWQLEKYTPEMDKMLEDFFTGEKGYKKFYQGVYNKAVAEREKILFENEKKENVNDTKNQYYNESLADLVKNVEEKERIIEYNGQLIQQINPIFQDPRPASILDYRAKFFSPEKNLLGATVNTYFFNILVIWIMTLFLYITLYFEALRKLMTISADVSWMKKK
jgi:hypothetical protein